MSGLSVSDFLQAGQTIITLVGVGLGALYVRGKLDGLAQSDNTVARDQAKKLWAELNRLSERATKNSEKIVGLEIENRMHLEECNRRYAAISDNQEKVVASVNQAEERLGMRINNLSQNITAQITAILQGRANRFIEVLPPKDSA